MAIIAIAGEKGGTGKSVVATNLAAMRAIAGRDVLLVDADTQGSSSGWQAVRQENTALPKVNCVQKFGKSLAAEVRDLATRYDDVLIDSGGRDSLEMRGALLVAQQVLMPFQPAQFDLWTLEKMHSMLEDVAAFNTDIRALAVINQAETNSSTTDYQDALEMMADYPGLELFEHPIRKRIAFKRATAQGMAVVEFEKPPKQSSGFPLEMVRDKASREMMLLYKKVFSEEFKLV